MIRINETLKHPVVDVWKHVPGAEKEEYVGKIVNDLQLHDLQLQIQAEKATGYMCYWKGQMVKIDENGGIDNWPEGFYTKATEQLNKLYGI